MTIVFDFLLLIGLISQEQRCTGWMARAYSTRIESPCVGNTWRGPGRNTRTPTGGYQHPNK